MFHLGYRAFLRDFLAQPGHRRVVRGFPPQYWKPTKMAVSLEVTPTDAAKMRPGFRLRRIPEASSRPVVWSDI